MRPLARWTFGKSSGPGRETLRCSVRRFRSIYPEFDLVVCCNNLSDGDRAFLGGLNVPVHNQAASELAYPLVPADATPGWKHASPGWGWKLVPPRLRPDAHELWIDNDLIVLDRLPSVDRWLQSGRSIISTGHRREYGSFEHTIRQDAVCCAGFFGLPPGFDFASRIYHYCGQLDGRPLGYYDEQGLTTSVVLEADPIFVPVEELAIVKRLSRPFPKGLHFIGVNRTERHELWEDYKCSVLM